MVCNEYIKPKTIKEALNAIRKSGEKAIFIAGATDVMVKARSLDAFKNSNLIDLSEISELNYIKQNGKKIEIGAMTTISELLKSKIIKEKCKILWDACKNLGSPQIRNKATIGGNLANACLAADTIPPLCVLNAYIVTTSPEMNREIPVSGFLKKSIACVNHEEMTVSGCYYANPAGKKNILEKNEIITHIVIPESIEEYVCSFQKIGRKSMGCMSRFSLAIALKKKAGKIDDIRMSIGAAFSDITLLEDECNLLINSSNPEDFKKVAYSLGDKIENQVKNKTDNIVYKASVCKKLTYRTLVELFEKGEVMTK